MQLRFAGRLSAFKNLLHEVDAAPWPIQFIAHQLAGGTCGVAKSTMNTLPQNGFRFLSYQRVLKLGCELGLHGEPQKCALILRGPNRPAGSNSFFNAC